MIVITSAINADMFVNIRTVIGILYNIHSTIDLNIKIPTNVDAIALTQNINIFEILCLLFFNPYIVGPNIMPITKLPSTQPGIPLNPLIKIQYIKVPKQPTIVPLNVPTLYKYTTITTYPKHT